MVRFVAHFDGKQLLPDEPVNLPIDRPLQVTVEEVPSVAPLPPLNLTQLFESIVSETGLVDGPEDWSAHHDQYLYGAPSGDGPDGD
jgi:hypothetical protein